MKYFYIAASFLLLTGFTNIPSDNDDIFEAKDPLKTLNQAIFSFNLVVDKNIIKPVAEAYDYVPFEVRGAINNFLSNLDEPDNVVNGILQLDADLAFTSFWRFALNSTYGFAGLRDFAGENGLKSRDTDFGKTLGRYGIGDGAYLVLPLAGPSTYRDTAGAAVDWFIDPVGLVFTVRQSATQIVANAINTRNEDAETINQFYYKSLDPYVATRAAYLQHSVSK